MYLFKEFIKRIILFLIIISIFNSIVYFGINNQNNNNFNKRIYNDFTNIERFKEEFSFNKNFFVQNINYLKRIVTFDFGYSFSGDLLKVTKLFFEKSWNSIVLIVGCIIVIFFQTSLYFKLAMHFKWIKNLVFIFSRFPIVIFAMVSVKLFAIRVNIFQIAGMKSGFYEELGFFSKIIDLWSHMFLPALTISMFFSGLLFEKYNNNKKKNILEVFKKTFSMIMIDSYYIIPGIISLLFIIENIFIWPGIGKLFYTSIKIQDFPQIYAIGTYVISFLYIFYVINNFFIKKYRLDKNVE